jgi:hypothetical protein
MSYSEEPELAACLTSSSSIQERLMSTYEYDEGVYELMLMYCKKTDLNKLMSMFDFLIGFLERAYAGQRVVVISCFAQFINFASLMNNNILNRNNLTYEINEWREKLIGELIKTIMDSNELARKQSIRGLSNLCKVYLESVRDVESYIKIKENTGKLQI